MNVANDLAGAVTRSIGAGEALRTMQPIVEWPGRHSHYWSGKRFSDLAKLAGLIEERSTAARSHLHGWAHWRSVAAVGCRLSVVTAGADMGIVLVFSLLHDVERLNDDEDPEHGVRAAGLVRVIGADLGLSAEGTAVLAEACARHNRGGTTTEPTIGVCWDADRLNLPRVGIEPSRRYLSTDAGKEASWIEYGRRVSLRAADWINAVSPFEMGGNRNGI